MEETYKVIAYFVYLTISIGLTVWVARTLSKNGRIFLVDSFGGNSVLAESGNHRLVVGFYLINIGYVGLALKSEAMLETTSQAMEFLSGKVGLVLIILGGMHFFNFFVFSRIRRRALLKSDPPPVMPERFVENNSVINSATT